MDTDSRTNTNADSTNKTITATTEMDAAKYMMDTPYFDQVFPWFKEQFSKEQTIQRSPAGKALTKRFKKIYANKHLSKDMFEPNSQIKKYQADWEHLFLQNEECMPPIPEAYFLKLSIMGAKDQGLQACLDQCMSISSTTRYVTRTFQGLCSQVTERKSAQKTYDEILANNFAKKCQEEDNFETDLNLLMSMVRLKTPKSFNDLIEDLKHQSAEAFKRMNLKMFITCRNLSNAGLFVTWKDSERLDMHNFLNDPTNKAIIDRWTRGSQNGTGEPQKLSFPSPPPNNISPETLESFIGYFCTKRFAQDLFILSAVEDSITSGRSIGHCLKIAKETMESMM